MKSAIQGGAGQTGVVSDQAAQPRLQLLRTRWNAARSAFLVGGLALLLGILLTAAGLWWQAEIAAQLSRAKFEQGAERTATEVLRRLNQAISGLKAARAAMVSNPNFRRQNFRTYVNSIDLARDFPGSRGLGFVERVRRADLSAFVAAERADGAPGFALPNAGNADDVYVLKYLEPQFDGTSAIGMDLGQDALRRAAMDYAVSSGEATLLSRIERGPGAVHAARLSFFLPVYRHGSQPQTASQRKQAIQGLLYVPMNAQELFGAVSEVTDGAIDFELFDSASTALDSLVYDADGRYATEQAQSRHGTAPARVFSLVRQYTVGGHLLTLRLRSGAQFALQQEGASRALIGIGGALGSVLLALSVWLLVVGRQRAQALAQGMTVELERMAQVVQHTENAVTIMDAHMRIVWVNRGFSQITGYSLEEALGKTPGGLLSSGKSSVQALRVLIESAMQGVSCRVELINRAKDGHEYWADTEVQPTFDAEHKLIGFMEIGTDISQQKLTQQKLEAAMRDASALLGTVELHAIVSSTDRFGNIVDVNAAFCSISGYSRAELQGQNHRIVNSGHHPQEFWRHLWTTIGSGKPWRGEICNRSKDGRLYWVDSMIAPFVGSDGAIEKYIDMQTDITERHEAADRLRKSEATFYASFQYAASGAAFLSPGGTWMSANPALCEFLGFSEAQLHGLTYIDTSHPQERETDALQIQRLLDGDIPVYQRAKRFVHHDGHTLWGLASLSVVWSDAGKAEFVIAQIVDITERKRVEEALSTSNILMEETQAVAQVGAWQLDVPNNALYWTPETYRIHELSPEQFHLTIDSAMMYCTEDSKQRIAPALRHAVESATGFDLELELLTAKGHRADVRVTGTPALENGQVVRISGIVQDITQRKQYEASLREARVKAEMATHSKGQFLANMSHEIRTPMNAILGMLKLLRKTALDGRQLDYAEKTESAARSLLGLINDILDFSKVEEGKMSLDPHAFQLDRLMRDLAVILSNNVGTKGIEVLFDIDPAIPTCLVGDALRLQQVLVNLGGNAIKFTAEGQVLISVRLQQQNSSHVTLEFAVQDSGIGIAPENQAHIFTGFSQAEASTTRKFGGTGLGLAISRRLVDLMGGTLGLRSTLGQGSTFYFTLDLPISDEEPATTVPLLLSNGPAKRVLVIEKNPVAGQLLLRMVQSWGWSCELVSSGEAALHLVTARQDGPDFPFDAVYLDWHLPAMDGWETTACLRRLCQEAGQVQPVIVMVCSNTRETLDQRTAQEQASINSFLVKPVTASMLLEATLASASSEFRLRQRQRGPLSQRLLNGMRILVVEDNLINQQVAEELLSSEGALVALAANGQLGVDAIAAGAQGEQFHAVLMDLQMPILDGYAATRMVREQLGLKDLPIIAMTANAMASDREECLNAGMNDHIGKPFDLSQLVATLLRITGFQAKPDARAAPALVVGAEPVVAAPVLLERLPQGIDVAAALGRMGGMTRLYARSVRAFIDSLPESMAQIRAAALLGAADTAMLAHTLKGTAAMLGAVDLSLQAAALERLCKAAADAGQLRAALDALELTARVTRGLLSDCLLELEGAPPSPPPPSSSSSSSSSSSAAAAAADSVAAQRAPMLQATMDLLDLLGLLEAEDFAALEKFATVREQLLGLPEGLFNALEAALQDLDLAAAGAVCRRILDGAENLSGDGR